MKTQEINPIKSLMTLEFWMLFPARLELMEILGRGPNPLIEILGEVIDKNADAPRAKPMLANRKKIDRLQPPTVLPAFTIPKTSNPIKEITTVMARLDRQPRPSDMKSDAFKGWFTGMEGGIQAGSSVGGTAPISIMLAEGVLVTTDLGEPAPKTPANPLEIAATMAGSQPGFLPF